MARKRRHGLGTLLGAFLISLVVIHPLALVIYEQSRPVIDPLVMLAVDGEGVGLITSEPIGLHCGDAPDSVCRARFAEGTEVVFTATIGEKSTFDGWSDDCGAQAWRGYRWAVDVLGDWVSDPLEADEFMLASARPIGANPLQCRVKITSTTRLSASFGLQPDEVDVKWVTLPDEPTDSKVASSDLTITLPDPSFTPENIIEPEPMPDEMELEDQTPPEPEPEIAQVEPQPPQPQPQAQAAPQKQPVEAPKLKSVEVPDENEVEEAPDDAAFLSDKNRDVSEQTVAKQTNLEREQKGDKAFSEESDVKSDEIGAKEDEIAELEDTEPSDIEPQKTDESAHSGKEKIAEGVLKGDEGEAGDEGDAGNDKPSDKPGVLAMRGIDGRGAPGGPIVAREIEAEGDGARGDPGDGGKRGRRGTKGRRGIKTDLEFEDYKRIVGADKVKDEQKLAKRQVSKRRGRWEKKLSAIQSSLENFTPEVRPGNQTALKTRAAPFAVYIARMHRRIHKLWGFGFLEDLDSKPSSHEMNNWNLWSKIEVIVNPDGTIDKLTIIKPSGVLPFDVAALDTIYSAGPFEPPPQKIRSPDGKTYMHWAFHRDWRQCGTFGVQPFILAEPPQKRHDKGFSDGDMVKNRPRVRKREGDKPKNGEVGMPRGPSAASHPDAAAATARATASMPTPDDPAANHTANLWLTGFTKRDVSKMVKVSGVPFRSGDKIVASRASELAAVYKNILAETRGRPTKTRLLSPGQYRQTFGALPGGLESKGTELFYVVRLRGEQFTLILEQGKGGDYRITGFYR